jgi:dTDP-4-dehydrorhamnose reductase
MAGRVVNGGNAVRYALLGAAGQLGRELVPRLEGDVIALDRQRADLTRTDALLGALAEVRPDVVVNCAAFNLVDRAEAEPAAAFAVNAWGVRELARWCGKHDRLLVQFSTDHVFGLDGQRHTPWTEADAPGPVSVYGLSKLAGEYMLRSLCPRHLIVRTCGLYGLHGSGGKGTNFVETMLRLAREGRPLRVVNDQTCTPTSAADLAGAVVRLLGMNRPGLYHLTNAGACSWHTFAAAIFALAKVSANLTAVNSAEYAAAARRPRYSVLEPAAARAAGLAPLRPWREALADYLEQRGRSLARRASEGGRSPHASS